MRQTDRRTLIIENGCQIFKNLSLENMEGEYWQDCVFNDCNGRLKDFAGLYMVSNLGRVKSLRRDASRHTYGGDYFLSVKEKILRQGVCKKRGGYLVVCLRNKGSGYSIQVGVLVAKVFIPNPENKRTVNHKKGDVWDNRVSEIEWNTDSENNLHAFRVLGRKKHMLGRIGELSPFSRKIVCLNTGEVFVSQRDAAAKLNIRQGEISRVCNGIRKDTQGYKFSFL